MELNSVYKFKDDVYLGHDKEKEACKIIKLDDNDFFFHVTFIAAEIVSLIDGSRKYSEIINLVSNQYEDEHRLEIESRATELLDTLLKENLITEI